MRRTLPGLSRIFNRNPRRPFARQDGQAQPQPPSQPWDKTPASPSAYNIAETEPLDAPAPAPVAERPGKNLWHDRGANVPANFFSCSPREKVESLDLSGVGIMNIFHKDEKSRIPRLNKTLEPMMSRQGIYHLSEMKDKIADKDFDHLSKIPQPSEITMEAISDYTHASKDPNLLRNAVAMHCSLITSTSACSSLLSHISFAISLYCEPNLTFLRNFSCGERIKYMNAQKKPYSHCLRIVDAEKGIWGLDSFPSIFEPNHLILMELGKILERVYTMEPEQFEATFVKGRTVPEIIAGLEKDYHRFMILNKKIALRSQIDCHSTIDGTDRIFEIKTRAVAPIRYDITNYTDYLDYRISSVPGFISSYEREFYDLVRGGMLKYFFQLKIGAMDGAFVGYHNTQEHFGFEYLKLSTIERVLFGSTFRANVSFAICSRIMSMVIDRVKDLMQGEKFNFLNFSVFADALDHKLIFMVEPVNYIEYDEFRKMELKKTEDMGTISDFYRQRVGKENVRVMKIELFLYPKLNGVYNPLFLHTLGPTDLVEMDYLLQVAGFIRYEEYMQFMLYASKHDLMIIEQKYLGFWGTFNTSYNMG